MSADKAKALESVMASLEKEYGKGSVMMLGDSNKHNIETTPSGSIGLDIALGGGYAKGRIVEIYGAESSGKTTLTLHAIAEAQKLGLVCAFVDAEHAFDPSYATKLGIDTKKLIFSQPDYGEQALEIVDALIHSGAVDLVVVDSVAALTPKAEIEGDMGDSHMGLQARMMSQGLRKITGAASKNNVTVIFINQTRMKIGVVFGNPETTTWGNALKFYASQRLSVSGTGKIEGKSTGGGDDKDKEFVGKETKVKVIKNKVAPPFREAEFQVEFNKGISKTGEIIEFGSKFEVIKKSGAFYSYGDVKLGQGKENAKAFLEENPEVKDEIEAKVRECMK